MLHSRYKAVSFWCNSKPIGSIPAGQLDSRETHQSQRKVLQCNWCGSEELGRTSADHALAHFRIVIDREESSPEQFKSILNHEQRYSLYSRCPEEKLSIDLCMKLLLVGGSALTYGCEAWPRGWKYSITSSRDESGQAGKNEPPTAK